MAFQYNPPNFQEYWDRAQTLSTTPGFNGWTTKKTGAGTPTFTVAGKSCAIALDATSEAQVAVLYQNNVLPWKLSEIRWVEFVAKVSGIDAVSTLCMGLASTQNDTADSIAYNAFFRMEGSASLTNVVVETDDATNDNNDVATGKTLAATYKRFLIDFQNGLEDVRFKINGIRVASGTTFDMSAGDEDQGLQFITQIQKASGTGVPSVTLGPIVCKRVYEF
jgi:hypothetical protein